MKKIIFSLSFLVTLSIYAQKGYWQQEITYKMEVDVEVEKYLLKGKQEIEYTNHSPDDLTKLYFHLYYNAFQPKSMMDERSRSLPDPDRRVQDRINQLKPDEIGKQDIQWVTVEGEKVNFVIDGTIMEVTLNEPIESGDKVTIKTAFEAQIPKQIRRTGRNNRENIELSMTQWYPKLSEYDNYGWHPNPYIGREFHGVFGTFDVKLTLPAAYVVAASGYIQNPEQVGHRYSNKKAKGEKITWHFKTPKVHDFAWAADKDYQHDIWKTKSGMELHFFYKKTPNLKDKEKINFKDNWKTLQLKTEQIFDIMAKYVGKYPYDTYSVIQGGDGGMEYAMNTLITGHRPIRSLVEVTAHEVIHSWFQHFLATNESRFAWMDEGFTSFLEDVVMSELYEDIVLEERIKRTRLGYASLSKSNKAEPMTHHADHFDTNFAYGRSSYTKGALFLAQLKHILGDKMFWKTMKDYYQRWQFKHPEDEDFIRIAEKNSGYVLDWYLDYWIHTTKEIDYQVRYVSPMGDDAQKTQIVLTKNKPMPLPQVVHITLNDGKTHSYFIPLRIMRGDHKHRTETVLPDWPWVNSLYRFDVPFSYDQIKSVELDTRFTGDVSDLGNDIWSQ